MGNPKNSSAKSGKSKPSASPRRRTQRQPGPKPSITLDVVKRVSDRVGRGLTLALALAAENNDKINVETWKKALKAHAEFSPHYEAGKGKFLDMATLRLAASGDLKNLRWLLERRHADLFGGPAVDSDVDRLSINVSANASAGIPEDILERARQLATEQSKSQRPKSKADGSA